MRIGCRGTCVCVCGGHVRVHTLGHKAKDHENCVQQWVRSAGAPRGCTAHRKGPDAPSGLLLTADRR